MDNQDKEKRLVAISEIQEAIEYMEQVESNIDEAISVAPDDFDGADELSAILDTLESVRLNTMKVLDYHVPKVIKRH